MLVESARHPPAMHVVVVSGRPERSSMTSAFAGGRAEVGIVFALTVEADALERLAGDRRETRGDRFTFVTGLLATRRVAWCISGVGRTAAAAAARQIVDGHGPRLLVSAGFAGGLDPALPRGSVVRPQLTMLDHDTRRLPLLAPADDGPPAATPLTIVTTDAVVGSVEAKRALASRSGGQLVDMETFAVAEVAVAAGLPCAAVRVISDAADASLPGDVAMLAAPQSSLRRLGAAVTAISRRPATAVDLWRLWEHAVVDARTLAGALVDVIRETGIHDPG